MNAQASDSRCMLWIDAVGGLLVCTASEIRIGQAVPGAEVELPLLGDISRHQATIRREEDCYVLDPLRETKLGGRLIKEPALLVDGCELELGRGVRLRFRRPHPLSATARLEFASHHRSPLVADGVLLVAETCVLGPQSTSHVVCRPWKQEVVLSHRDGNWTCRSKARLEVNGREAAPSGTRLTLPAQVSGEEISFRLERV